MVIDTPKQTALQAASVETRKLEIWRAGRQSSDRWAGAFVGSLETSSFLFFSFFFQLLDDRATLRKLR